MIYLCCIDMRCSSFLFTFSLPSFDFPSFFSYYLFHFRSIPTPIHLSNLTHFFTSFTLFVDGLTTSPSFSFHSQHLHRLLLSSHAHETLLRVVHYGFDHWVFEPNFLSFLYIFILAYVTSRVLRPPWGHEIRRHLWQSSLEQAFADWLKNSCYYVFSYERYFWKHLVSLLLGILMFDGFLSLGTVH